MLIDPWRESFRRHPARRLAAGAFVYLKGDSAQSLYLLRAGLVKISVVWRDGRELIVRVARPGELFGKTSLGAAERLDPVPEGSVARSATQRAEA